MSKPLTLTDAQMETVRVAAATLRLRGRDKFLQALAVERGAVIPRATWM
jgi:hypothetical protein